ncbi:hypothetical protein KVT40_002119 [Elsinoe batatas]|uniref:Uncharacterized protein n=1 Tax=Elsinoe batatas TaxID=2601811 RepID=A0A8K0L813_9PEZI|nr:hypothetical protein KVT40_002119 [Elsinoe batatas]
MVSKKGFVDPRLLDKIDRLFAAGVGDYLGLPQLVVVGDQSSGKSSVLEGLTSIPFPRDSGLCTRFATQITFRRAYEQTFALSLIPPLHSTPAEAERLRAWRKDVAEFDVEVFTEIMSEVNKVLDLRDAKGHGGSQTFSDAVLKLDISGPDQQHFSVVDVPGIFRVSTEGITTDSDRDLVRAMVQRYMENPRSVILTIVPANVDVATQEILTLAKAFDPDGNRTIGVLTKPDLVDKGGENNVLDLLRGQKHRLKLGWHVVRNLAQHQIDSGNQDRASLELSFFSNNIPWSHVTKTNVGIGSLRARLTQILDSLIRREYPQVQVEIRKELHSSRTLLDSLGSPRTTAAEQTRYLLEVSERFQTMVDHALYPRHEHSQWFEEVLSRRLSTYFVNRSERLEKDLHEIGHTYQFCREDQVVLPVKLPSKRQKAFLLQEDPDDDFTIPTRRVRLVAPHTDLEELEAEVTFDMVESKSGIMPWLEKMYSECRGLELGTFDGALLQITMRQQCEKWQGIAYGYILDIITNTHIFAKDLLGEVCTDERIRAEIAAQLTDGMLERYKAALDQVSFLLETELQCSPFTVNHYFNSNLQKSRDDRVQNRAKSKAFDDCSHGTVVRLEDVHSARNVSNAEHMTEDMHNILSAYYKVARKRFADNLTKQAADYWLVTGPKTPLRLFSSSFVARLSPDTIEMICREEEIARITRTELTTKIETLEAARRILI